MKKFSLKIFSNKLNILQFLFYIFPAVMLTSSGYITVYTSILTIYTLFYFDLPLSFLHYCKLNLIQQKLQDRQVKLVVAFKSPYPFFSFASFISLSILFNI